MTEPVRDLGSPTKDPEDTSPSLGEGRDVSGKSGWNAAEPDYDSLEDFCLQTQVDTPANCACGQATANDIMSDAEQELTLTMMITGEPPVLGGSEAQAAFFEKVSQVTSGCGG